MSETEDSTIHKIFDGLYIGDYHSVYDQQTISLNYINFAIITHRPPSTHLFTHLHYHQADDDHHQLLPFVQKAKELGESCIIYGKDLHTPSHVLASYIMAKFKWSLFKTLEYVNWRLPGVDLNVEPLKQLELQMIKEGKVITYSWEKYQGIGQDQLIIRNTFINSKADHLNYEKIISSKNITTSRTINSSRKKVKWVLATPSEKSPKRHGSLISIKSKSQMNNFLNKAESQTAKQKIVLNVMDIIGKSKNPKKGLNKSSKCNQSRARLPTLQELEQEKKNTHNNSLNHRSKTQIEEEKENVKMETIRTESSEPNYKRMLVEETVRKLKQMKASTKGQKVSLLRKKQFAFNQ